MQTIRVIDSHTGGEPTRVIVADGPDLGGGSLAERRAVFAERFDHIRSAVVNEPRGSEAVVGAILCEPVDRGAAAGVIFFNNTGFLNMCGHGTIGVAVTLAYLDRIGPGRHRLETPVGIVDVTLQDAHHVTLRNVPSYRSRKGVSLEIPGHGTITGDVAWGGNWFFLCGDHGLELELRHVRRLTDFCWQIREQLTSGGITGADGGEIDHIELFGAPGDPTADSRNFVLCPGGAYDRSPCGTGTSAKMACLHADGRLQPGQSWRQESIIGSIFEGSIEVDGPQIIPTVTGSAYVCSEATLILQETDPFRNGIEP